jgi:hypothetical protein
MPLKIEAENERFAREQGEDEEDDQEWPPHAASMLARMHRQSSSTTWRTSMIGNDYCDR